MSIERKLNQFEVHLKQLKLQNRHLFREPLTEKLDEVIAEIEVLRKEIKSSSKKGRAAQLQITANNVKAFREKVNLDLSLEIINNLQFNVLKSELLKRLNKLRKELYDINLVQNWEVIGKDYLPKPSWLSNNEQ